MILGIYPSREDVVDASLDSFLFFKDCIQPLLTYVCTDFKTKGSRRHLYFSHGVLKVVRSELSLSNSTIQYPEAASPSVKYFPLWSSALTSSIVFEQYWFLLMLLLRSFGSRHSRIDPSGLETGTTLLIQSVSLNWFNDFRTAQSFKLFFVCCFLLLRYCSRWMLYRLCVWLELDMVLAPW